MNVDALDLGSAGREMYSLAADLFPICRSMTGPGVRETLRRLQEYIPLQLTEVPTGTKVFDCGISGSFTITYRARVVGWPLGVELLSCRHASRRRERSMEKHRFVGGRIG